MATKIRRGDAVHLPEQQTITVGGTWANAETLTLTMNNKDIVITFGAGVPTTAQVAAAIKACWEGDAVTAYGETRTDVGTNIPEFAEITASVSSSVVTLEHDDTDGLGIPFTLSVAETSAIGTLVLATARAAKGPALADDADNWDTNGAPADNDAIVFEALAVDMLYNLTQSGIGPASIDILQSYTGQIGLPRYNAAGYWEYRSTYWTQGDAAIATTINVGRGEGSGSGRIKINLGAGQTTLNGFNTGSPVDDGIEAFLFLGTHASNAANIRKGSYGFAVLAGEACTLLTLNVGYIDNKESDAKVRGGTGLTLTTLNQVGGVVELNAGLTTVNQSGGTLRITAGAITTVNLREGTLNYTGAGSTLSTVNVHQGGVLDLTGGLGLVTITTFNLFPGAKIIAPRGRLTGPPVIRLNGCTTAEVTIQIEDDYDVDHV